MTSALWFLTFQLLWKRISVQVRRLRRPRYFAGALGSGLYFYLVFFRNASVYQRMGGANAAFVGSVLLLMLTALPWILSSRPALVFTPAEVQFLFLAPLTRRQLVQYKLMAIFVGAATSSLLFTAMFRRTAAAPMFFVGTWLVISTLGLHGVARSLSRQSLKEHGVSGIRRQRIVLSVLCVVLIVIFVAAAQAWPRLSATHGLRELLAELERVTTSGPAWIVFWPFRALVAPALSNSVGAFARSVPAVLVMFALNYLWVMHADVAFEEASASQAHKIADRLKEGRRPARPRRARAAVFSLAETGRPEFAVLWKNMIQTGRYTTRGKVAGILIGILMMMACVVIPMRSEPVAESASVLLGMAAVSMLFFGPQNGRNDFRRDLSQIATLKTWPVRGAVLARGEILGSSLPLIVLTLLCIVGLMVLQLREPDVVPYGVAALALTPGLIVIQIVFQNGIALVFPAWLPSTTPGAVQQGIGMRYVMLIINTVGLLIALIPPAAIAAIVGFAQYLATHQIPIVGPAVAGAVALLIECWIGAELLGGRFERMDVSAIDPAQ